MIPSPAIGLELAHPTDRRRPRIALALACSLLLAVASASAAETYNLDAAHTSAVFRIKHAGLSDVYGRFNAVQGTVVIDPADLSTAHFDLSAQVESINTGNDRRDQHLRSPDFFDARQFPTITFKSTAAKPTEAGLQITGDLALHGVTRSVSFTADPPVFGQFPPGTHRVGITASFTIKRSDFGMTKMTNAVGDEVTLLISFEAIRQ